MINALDTFHPECETNVKLSEKVLSTLPCGLHRAPLEQAWDLMPELGGLFDTVPVFDPSLWVIDVKIHMLFKNQYPCIPNWHCDNVPRNADGKTDYSLADYEKSMMIWISDGPETEILDAVEEGLFDLESHADLPRLVAPLAKTHLFPQTWYSFSQLSPHRGTAARKRGWRVFARATCVGVKSVRPVNSHIRRHCQVYLDASQFSW